MNILFKRELYNGDPIINFTEDGKTAGFIVRMQEPMSRNLRLSNLEDICVILDGKEEFHLFTDMKLETKTGIKDPATFATDGFNRWDFAETAKIYVYTEGGIPVGEHHLEAGVLVRSPQDSSIGSAYEGISLDFVME